MVTAEIHTPDATCVDLTAVDLAERFGPIPLRRIVLGPRLGEATEDDLVDQHERTRRIYELVDGILVEKAVGLYESWLAGRLLTRLNVFLERNDLGFAAGEAGMLRLVAGLVRAPDVSFVNWNRVVGRRVPRQPVPHLSPNLAVEVLSRSNTRREMDRKLDDYFASGVELVWYVDPESRTVRVFAARDAVATLGAGDTLDGGGVLPGFAVAVADLLGEQETEAAE